MEWSIVRVNASRAHFSRLTRARVEDCHAVCPVFEVRTKFVEVRVAEHSSGLHRNSLKREVDSTAQACPVYVAKRGQGRGVRRALLFPSPNTPLTLRTRHIVLRRARSCPNPSFHPCGTFIDSLKGTMCLEYPPHFRARLTVYLALICNFVREPPTTKYWPRTLCFKDERQLNRTCNPARMNSDVLMCRLIS